MLIEMFAGILSGVLVHATGLAPLPAPSPGLLAAASLPSPQQGTQRTKPGKRAEQETPPGKRDAPPVKPGKPGGVKPGGGGVRPKGGGSLQPGKTEPMTEAARARLAIRKRCTDELVQGKLSAGALAEFFPTQRILIPTTSLQRLARALQTSYGNGRIQPFHFNGLLTRLREEMLKRPMTAKDEEASLFALFAEWKGTDEKAIPEVAAAYRDVHRHARRFFVERRLPEDRRLALQKVRLALRPRADGEEPAPSPPTATDILWIWKAEGENAALGRPLADALVAAWTSESANPDRVVDVVLEVAGWVHDGKRKRRTAEQRSAELGAVLQLAGFDERRSTELAAEGRRLALALIKARKRQG